jgi:gamma-glutamyl-gamma-aminobutyrate hydrolase PuuD
MMNQIFLLCLLIFAGFCLPNQRPIIGIYTQVNEDDPPRGDSDDALQTFISASYIKFIQMSGAQVVPIFAYSNQSEIAALLPKLNGVLIPGGDLDFDIKNRWTSNANFIFKWAM